MSNPKTSPRDYEPRDLKWTTQEGEAEPHALLTVPLRVTEEELEILFDVASYAGLTVKALLRSGLERGMRDEAKRFARELRKRNP